MFGARLVLLLALALANSALAAGEEYFLVRPDTRKCAFPRCGGFYLDPVNIEKFDCPGGEVSKRSECYVAEIQGLPSTAGLTMVRGRFVPYTRSGGNMAANLNSFIALDGYQGKIHPHPHDNPDAFLSVVDTGITCATAPCNSIQGSKLNERLGLSRRMLFAGVDLSAFKNSETEIRDTMHVAEVIFATSTYRVEGPGGVGQGLLVSNYFTKVVEPPKPCSKSKDCEKTEFCSRDTCTSKTGLCKIRPFSCTKEYSPVCACDGLREYENDCVRQLFGATSSVQGKCSVTK